MVFWRAKWPRVYGAKCDEVVGLSWFVVPMCSGCKLGAVDGAAVRSVFTEDR